MMSADEISVKASNIRHAQTCWKDDELVVPPELILFAPIHSREKSVAYGVLNHGSAGAVIEQAQQLPFAGIPSIRGPRQRIQPLLDDELPHLELSGIRLVNEIRDQLRALLLGQAEGRHIHGEICGGRTNGESRNRIIP